MPRSPRRRWFRVSVRGLMVLVLLVGGGVGWLTQSIQARRRAEAAILKGTTEVEFEKYWPLEPTDPWVARAWSTARTWVAQTLATDVTSGVVEIHFFQPVPADILTHLAWFTNLQYLTIHDTRAIRGGWDHLAGLTQLRYLNLGGCAGVDPAMLHRLSQIRSLDILTLRGVPATAEAFVPLANLPNLSTLKLYACPNLTDEVLARIVASLPDLQDLEFGNLRSRSPSGTLAALDRHHPGLTMLGLFGATLTRADCAQIARLPGLIDLDLGNSTIAPSGLAELARSPTLWHLSLAGTNVSAGDLADLADLAAPVTVLDLSRTGVTDAGLAHVARLPHLARLDLMNLPEITDAGLGVLHAVPTLNYVMLDALPRVTPVATDALRQLLRDRETAHAAARATAQ